MSKDMPDTTKACPLCGVPDTTEVTLQYLSSILSSGINNQRDKIVELERQLKEKDDTIHEYATKLYNKEGQITSLMYSVRHLEALVTEIDVRNIDSSEIVRRINSRLEQEGFSLHTTTHSGVYHASILKGDLIHFISDTFPNLELAITQVYALYCLALTNPTLPLIEAKMQALISRGINVAIRGNTRNGWFSGCASSSRHPRFTTNPYSTLLEVILSIEETVCEW